jgi:hypothetical protein
MEPELMNLLQKIRDGQTDFSAKSDDHDALKKFQPIAKALLYLEKSGYIESCTAHKSSRTGHGYYDLVIVDGGLTYEGEQILKSKPGNVGQRSIKHKSKEARQYKYNVALSFAGEDREYAEKLAELLSEQGLRVFYDKYEQADLWGKDLYQHFQSIYRDMASYCVIFLSQAYAQKLWTRHELKEAQARAFREQKEYILPVRIDDTEIPGISETVGYIDLRSTTIQKIAELLLKKLRKY